MPALLIITTVLLALFSQSHQQANSPPVFVETLAKKLEQEGISENTAVGTIIGNVNCSDPDGDRILYGAIKTSSLRVLSSTGVVQLIKPLDREQSVNSLNPNEKPNSVTFTCQDVDANYNPKSAQPTSVDLTITVVDYNDNAPVFSVSSVEGYSFSIREDAPVNKTLTPLLTITDIDRGSNAKLSSLRFTCAIKQNPSASEKDACATFGIRHQEVGEGSYTAWIFLKQNLDYEKRVDYRMALQAVDGLGADIQLTTSVGVRIIIEDTQDTEPFFTNQNYVFDVTEGVSVGSVVNFNLSARDGDVGAKRAIYLELLNDSQNLFRADQSFLIDVDRGIYSAQLLINKEINRENITTGYVFTAKATELENGTLTNATAIAKFSANIKDINDNSPIFSNSTYFITVPEMEYINSTVQIPNFRLDVSDADEPTNARFRLEIVSQTFPGAFGFTPTDIATGSASFFLTVNDLHYMDYDNSQYRQQVVQLRVFELLANDTRGPRNSIATVNITLTDINDNYPNFTRMQYQGSISENAMNFTSILTVSASDADEGQNGQFTFSIESRISTFYINPTSGEIRLNAKLDYEVQTEYSFLVFAVDKAIKPKTSQVPVKIFVTDYNDIGPVFSLDSYSTSITENSINFQSTVIVTATDKDANITYRILSGNTPNNSFQLDLISGRLTLREPLDYEALTNNGIFNLLIVATDSGIPPASSTSRIIISVLDLNDNVPIFSPTQYRATLSENEPKGTTILTVTATDHDSGSNGAITYRIGSGARDNFVVNALTGVFTVSNNPSFDYDLFKNYTVEIIATDGGSPQQSATATVTINITDANNKRPSFTQDLYTAIIDESTAIGTSVLQVSATDPDSTRSLQYSIPTASVTAINQAGAQVTATYPYDYRVLFQVDSSTGVVRVSSKLDREYVVEVTLIVQVTDVNGVVNVPQTETSRVTINIRGTPSTELYFNLPWTKANPVIEVPVLESMPVGTDIFTLQARDPVSGNTLVTDYAIVRNSQYGDIFGIDRATGILNLRMALDYESGQIYHTVVVTAAKDTRTATATVNILVQDFNDNAPEFSQGVYQYRVNEGAKYPYRLGVITATDRDSSSFGPIQYTLGGGIDSTDFILFNNSLGGLTDADLLVANILDYEKRSYYELDVIATDNMYGRGSAIRLSSRAKIIVQVLDENDNVPKFQDTSRNFSVPETAAIQTRLGQILATDLDFGLNGAITYSLIADPNGTSGSTPLSLFAITPNSGILLTKVNLRGQSGGYSLRVMASDQGSPPLTASIPISIKVQGTEDDDGTPLWLYPINNFVIYVYENHANERLNVSLQAKPRTTGARPIYSFSQYSDDYKSFSIDPNTAEIYVTTSLDREKKNTYTLVVKATDSLNSTLFSQRTILVSVLDLNDNAPSFKHTEYSACPSDFEVPAVFYADDNTPNGTFVAQVKACDPDGPGYNEMFYEQYTVPNNSAHICNLYHYGAFQVYPNGSIQANVTLDYEVHSEYLVCVTVSNRPPSIRKKRAIDTSKMTPTDTIAYVVLQIRDINDNVPVLPLPLDTAVFQSLPTSSVVKKIAATDPDGPQNNRILYSISSIMYYPKSGVPGFSQNGAFVINQNTGIVSSNQPSYQEFSNGFYLLNITVQDYSLPTLSNSMILKIVVYDKGEVLRVVLNKIPADAQSVASELMRKLQNANKQNEFYLVSTSEHKTTGSPDSTKSDICFVIVNNNRSLSASEGIEILDSSPYREVLMNSSYSMLDRGTCYSQLSSERVVKWRNLWWVLVAIGLFLFVCILIALITLCILHDQYKDYMNTHKTYMVPG